MRKHLQDCLQSHLCAQAALQTSLRPSTLPLTMLILSGFLLLILFYLLTLFQTMAVTRRRHQRMQPIRRGTSSRAVR